MSGVDATPEPRPAEGTGFLTGMGDPPPLPWSWLTEADLDRYADEFARSGFFGPVSYYRNLDANFDVVNDLAAEPPHDAVVLHRRRARSGAGDGPARTSNG